MTRFGMWRVSVWQTVLPSPRPSAAERAGLAASAGSEDPHVVMKIQAEFQGEFVRCGSDSELLGFACVFFFRFFFTF